MDKNKYWIEHSKVMEEIYSLEADKARRLKEGKKHNKTIENKISKLTGTADRLYNEACLWDSESGKNERYNRGN